MWIAIKWYHKLVRAVTTFCGADFWVGRRKFAIFLVRDAEFGCRVPARDQEPLVPAQCKCLLTLLLNSCI